MVVSVLGEGAGEVAVKLTHHVFCDICGVWYFTFVTTGRHVKMARDKAKAAGWAVKKSSDGFMVDICPDCQEEGK